jgi:ABC-type dipeptide/oligopeptide/nickel transport system permease component
MEAVLTYKSNMWSYILKRVSIAVLAFFVISFLIFSFINVAESSEVGPKLPNESLFIQYHRWLGDFFTGDWGESILGDSYYSK